MVAVLLVAGLALGGFVAVRALTDDTEGGAATDTSADSVSPDESTASSGSPDSGTGSASPTAPSAPTSSAPTEVPSTELPSGPVDPLPQACAAGAPEGGKAAGAVLRGGGLRAPRPATFAPMGVDGAFVFADKVVTVARQIEPTWIALYALGGLDRSVGYTSLEQAAETVLSCMTGSADFYQGFSGRTDQGSSALTVDGQEAWRITTEIRVDDPAVTVEGDVATVIVVDTGSAQRYGLFVSVVPIGDAMLVGQQEQVAGSITVD